MYTVEVTKGWFDNMNNDKEDIRLCASGKMLDKKMHEFWIEKEIQLKGYFVLEYSCQGIRRQLLRREPFIFARMPESEIPLICYDDIVMDKRRHSVIVRTPEGICSGIHVNFAVDRRKKAEFIIHQMYSCRLEELPEALDGLRTADKREYEPIDLSTYFNENFSHSDLNCIIDGGAFFRGEKVSLCEIPFCIGSGENNVIRPSAAPAENEDIIMNFGVPSRRRLCRPVSRDSLIEIPLHRPVRELFFIMALNGTRHQRWGFATDGTILGTPNREVAMPLSVTDTEGFMVELIYENGNRDTHFPLNLSLGYHAVQGDMGIYAIPADGSVVEKVIFHNRLLDNDCSIVAVTVNRDKGRQFPEMLTPEKLEKLQWNIPKRKKIALEGNILRMQNDAITIEVDIEEGFKLLKMTNRYTPCCTFFADYLLKLRDEQGNVTTGLMLTEALILENAAVITYRWKEQVEFVITATFSGKSDILLQLDVKNISREAVKTGVMFPCFTGLTYKDNWDSWYFFPKYQNINSNETVFIYEESAPSFPMQFLDVYSHSQQGGLSLTTREREQLVRKYGLEKDEQGISYYVEYPFMYGELQPGEVRKCSPTLLTAHSGDWRQSYRIYKDWLDSWYEPYKCQDKQWYRECFWLLAEITDFFETEEFTRLPVWYDEEKKEFRFKKILEEQKEISGYYPDILHLWAWTYRKENRAMQWGNFGDVDYELYGGVESFRNALHEVMEEKGVNVSLYLHPTLLSGRYPLARKFFPKYRVINKQGDYISIAGDSYRMCHANEEWRKQAISMYPRIYDELGIPLLYVDEFSLRIENRCYGEGHGHSIPSNLLKTDRDFITQLKDAMPEEVVLYGEYAAVDVNARYIDCNISYYIIDTVVDMIETAWRGRDGDDRLGPVLTNIYRFAFPKIVQLVLPMAMRNLSWHPQKFIFFNAEAIYDSFWDCEESSGHDFTVKAYGLKKKYADCFTSNNPETMVDTMTPAVCANCFPGKDRTVYTLYNRAYSTYRGKVLRIPHVEGNVYYDAWNNMILKPEIEDEFADISLTIDAQQVGCIEVKSCNKQKR